MPRFKWDKWYWSDWLNDIELQTASSLSRGIWANALGRMWHSHPRGQIKESIPELCKLLNCSEEEFSLFLEEIKRCKFGYVTQSNNLVTLRNRRMFKQEKLRQNTRLRVQKHRLKHKCNGDETGEKLEAIYTKNKDVTKGVTKKPLIKGKNGKPIPLEEYRKED